MELVRDAAPKASSDCHTHLPGLLRPDRQNLSSAHRSFMLFGETNMQSYGGGWPPAQGLVVKKDETGTDCFRRGTGNVLAAVEAIIV